LEGNWDRAPSQQHKQGGWSRSQGGHVYLSFTPTESTADLTKVIKMLTALFRTKSCFLLLHMPPLSLLSVCAISPTPGSPK
jgi:hypothetical protein